MLTVLLTSWPVLQINSCPSHLVHKGTVQSWRHFIWGKNNQRREVTSIYSIGLQHWSLRYIRSYSTDILSFRGKIIWIFLINYIVIYILTNYIWGSHVCHFSWIISAATLIYCPLTPYLSCFKSICYISSNVKWGLRPEWKERPFNLRI